MSEHSTGPWCINGFRKQGDRQVSPLKALGLMILAAILYCIIGVADLYWAIRWAWMAYRDERERDLDVEA